MKRYYVVMAFFAIMSGCVKDDQINITGKVVSLKDNQPVSSLAVSVGYLEFIGFWWDYRELATDVTSSKGAFELSYKEDDSFLSFKPHLTIGHLGPQFQPGARINGKFYEMVCLYSGFNDLADNGYYLIELIPITKAYLLKPNIPPGWETDTLDLQVVNLVMNPHAIGDDCKNDTTKFTLRLDNTEAWKEFQKVRNVRLGDELTIYYTISNGVLKKIGTFKKSCTFGDTTAVALPIW